MAKGFTEREKDNIRKRLEGACKQSWTQHGYKKTNVEDICRQAYQRGGFIFFLNRKKLSFARFYVLFRSKSAMLPLR